MTWSDYLLMILFPLAVLAELAAMNSDIFPRFRWLARLLGFDE